MALMDATVLSCIASYAQGMELLRIASRDLDHSLHMPSIAQIGKAAASFVPACSSDLVALAANPDLTNLMLIPGLLIRTTGVARFGQGGGRRR